MRTEQIMARRFARLAHDQVETQRCAIEEMRTLGMNTHVAERLHHSFARLIVELERLQKPRRH